MRSLAADGTASAARTLRGARTITGRCWGRWWRARRSRARRRARRRFFRRAMARGRRAMCRCSAMGTRSICSDEYQDVSTGFRRARWVFFRRRISAATNCMRTYQWFPKQSVVQSFGLETNQNMAFDHAHNRVYHYSTFDPFCAAAAEYCAGAACGGRTRTRWGRRMDMRCPQARTLRRTSADLWRAGSRGRS